MNKTLQILINENIPAVVDLINKRLRKSSFTFTAKLISERSEFIAAMKNETYDVILTDDDMELFDSTDVMTILKEHDIQTPVIVLSNEVSYYLTEALLKGGAFDVVHKDNSKQVIKCIERIINTKNYNLRKSIETT